MTMARKGRGGGEGMNKVVRKPVIGGKQVAQTGHPGGPGGIGQCVDPKAVRPLFEGTKTHPVKFGNDPAMTMVNGPKGEGRAVLPYGSCNDAKAGGVAPHVARGLDARGKGPKT